MNSCTTTIFILLTINVWFLADIEILSIQMEWILIVFKEKFCRMVYDLKVYQDMEIKYIILDPRID